MRRRNPSEYDGYEKKPESEWTEQDRKLLKQYGVVPLTEEGKKRFDAEVVEKSPMLRKFREVLAECVGKTVEEVDAGARDSVVPESGGEGE